MDWLVAWVLVALVCGFIAGAIGAKKGEGFLAFIIGAILGPLGILAAMVSKGNRRPCPFCKELIHKEAVVCPRCQRDVTAGAVK